MKTKHTEHHRATRKARLKAKEIDRIEVDLKPCPFCGSIDVEMEVRDDGGWWEDSIICPRCGIGFSTGHFGGGIEIDYVIKHSAKAWNRRA